MLILSVASAAPTIFRDREPSGRRDRDKTRQAEDNLETRGVFCALSPVNNLILLCSI